MGRSFHEVATQSASHAEGPGDEVVRPLDNDVIPEARGAATLGERLLSGA